MKADQSLHKYPDFYTFSFSLFQAQILLKELNKQLKSSMTITESERKAIVKAIGLSAGHWFKCPNGHYYCIGECGGAMQISKCIECGAKVGGQSHTLLADNRLAREMDGAQAPAWPTMLYNFNNYNLEI